MILEADKPKPGYTYLSLEQVSRSIIQSWVSLFSLLFLISNTEREIKQVDSYYSENIL